MTLRRHRHQSTAKASNGMTVMLDFTIIRFPAPLNALMVTLCVACRGPATCTCDHLVDFDRLACFTCDAPLCDACALATGEGQHRCPEHAEAGGQRMLAL